MIILYWPFLNPSVPKSYDLLKVLIVHCSNRKVMNKKETINQWKDFDC